MNWLFVGTNNKFKIYTIYFMLTGITIWRRTLFVVVFYVGRIELIEECRDSILKRSKIWKDKRRRIAFRIEIKFTMIIVYLYIFIHIYLKKILDNYCCTVVQAATWPIYHYHLKLPGSKCMHRFSNNISVRNIKVNVGDYYLIFIEIERKCKN